MRSLPQGPFAAAALGFLLLFFGRQLWIRRRTRRLFRRGSQVDRAVIEEQLEEINRETNPVTYFSERATAIGIRGKVITLNDGKVGFIGGFSQSGGWRTSPLIFAISKAADLGWFAEQDDIFSVVFSGTQHSIFRVKLAKIEEEMS